MRKKDKFIFYFLGIISPVFQIIIWISGINLIPSSGPYLPIFLLWLFSYPIFALVLQKKFEEFQFSKYKKLGGQLSEKTIQRMAFSWLILIIIFLIFVTLSTPMYLKVDYHTEAKFNLQRGIFECISRKNNNERINFSDINLFKSKFKKFKIQSINPSTCFKAKAIPKNRRKETWFEIDYDPEKGKVTKTCGDSSKPGCEEGNTW